FMEPHYVGNIIKIIKSQFHVADDVEITLETNPGTVNQKKIARFMKAGINRLSIGIQSFDDDDLKFLTRIHNSASARKTVLDSVEAGIENVSIDLIFNLPGQTKDKWKSNLLKAIDLPLKHISAYSLILEKGTILNKMVLDGKVEMGNDDHDADLYEITIDFLTKHGFKQYEVSNFSLPGYECRHNNSYWHYNDYFGFGPSAHSFVDGKRWWNYSSLKFYIENVNKKGNAIRGLEELTDSMMLNEYIMLALRSSGLDINKINEKFGEDWIIDNHKKIKKMEQKGYLTSDDNFIKFTPKGYAVCDEILKNII
ncbi:radical SAM family heme chaperone HemW, partial [Bacteroidota bacterium]